MMNHGNPRKAASPEESEATVRMAQAMCSYRVTNSAGGTELRTRDKGRAMLKINRLQFPGDVLVKRGDGPERALVLEVDQDGLWVEVG